jgi:hypothetical protein
MVENLQDLEVVRLSRCLLLLLVRAMISVALFSTAA